MGDVILIAVGVILLILNIFFVVTKSPWWPLNAFAAGLMAASLFNWFTQ